VLDNYTNQNIFTERRTDVYIRLLDFFLTCVHIDKYIYMCIDQTVINCDYNNSVVSRLSKEETSCKDASQ